MNLFFRQLLTAVSCPMTASRMSLSACILIGLVIISGCWWMPVSGFGADPQPSQRPVCFKHKNRDTIKTNGLAIKGKNDIQEEYRTFNDGTGKYEPFAPGTDWIVIDGNDPCCKPETKPTDDIPHGWGKIKPELKGGAQ